MERKMNFVTIDFETAQYARESACSVGLVKYRNGKPVDTWYYLIRPPVLYIRPDFTEIHGLTVDDVRDAPVFAEVWEDVLPVIGGLPLAAHNASFDMGVLRAALEWYELPVPHQPYFCTLALARRAWPELESHALTSLGAAFAITYEAHNALDDARTCGMIACMAAEKFDSRDITGLLRAAGLGLRTM
jgi:DNA polymerase-3 subunit epsilon